jgi:diguanylate cyclase
MGQTQTQTFTRMALIHIDAFKRINDQCGNLVGDQTIQQIAQLLQQHSQGTDWLCRFSGVEFMLLMTDPHIDAAYERCEALRHAIGQIECVSFQQSWSLSASIGLMTLESPFDTHHSLSMVSQMLYQARQRGGNCTVFAEQVTKRRRHATD